MNQPSIRERWQALFPKAPPERELSTRVDLLRRYNEPHRKYHTTDHLFAGFAELSETGYGHADRDVVDVAWLCHDIFYDTRAVNNEKRSAVWCRNVTRMLGRPELGEPAAACILATRHDRAPLSIEAQLVCDVDLSILGAEPQVFDEYERQIREEYEWVPLEQFRAARAAILKRILSRPIYHWHVYRTKYQETAEQNLRRSISKLSP